MDYGEYLELDALLKLQRPRSDGPARDELLFIVIHQVYELWFKLALFEIEQLRTALEGGDTADATATTRRLVAIQRVLNGQLEVLETMTPAGFAAFRSHLEQASGFQSYQFREVEILLGKRDPDLLKHYPEGSSTLERLKSRLEEPSVYATFLRSLATEGGEVQTVLREIYRAGPSPALELCEALVDLDEGLQEWRYRHVKLVERFIGTKGGTGGSSGADYLRGTLFQPLFPDLWAVRSEI